MRRSVLPIVLATTLGCAVSRAPAPSAAASGAGSILRAAELARARCLLVAPFENGSDAPGAGEAATDAVLSALDATRGRLFPIPELRGLFRDTPLELPQGLPPSLALELADLVGADAALWGSVAGRSRDAPGELLVTIRLSLVADRRLLFADTALVKLARGERLETAIRRAVLERSQPMLARIGAPGRRRCFDPERSRTLRRFALAEASEARAVSAPPKTPVPAPKAEPRTPRQAEWAKRLAEGGRLHVDDLTFEGRSAELLRDGGLGDLAVALFARPTVSVRLEGFVDATSDRAADAKLSSAMAQTAGRRLVELGIPRSRVSWVGRGGESPILPNFTARGRAANRRIEAVAVPSPGG